MRRLPPLDTLRVFEAAARLRSFKAAGRELNVTASAVSHRIAALEREIGTALFVRRTRRIELTAAGDRLAAGMVRALSEIRRSMAAIDATGSDRLRIAAIPSHVTRWLAPRLHRFQLDNPDIDIHVAADVAVIDLGERTVDVALRFGSGDYPGLHVERLMGDTVVLVASPRYLERHGPVEHAGDLMRLTRIYDTTAESDDSGVSWRYWLGGSGMTTTAFDKGLQFNGAVLTIEAAAGGLGVAVTRRSLVAADIAAHRLVTLLDREVPTRWSHYAVSLPELADWPPVRSFITWLKREIDERP